MHLRSRGLVAILRYRQGKANPAGIEAHPTKASQGLWLRNPPHVIRRPLSTFLNNSSPGTVEIPSTGQRSALARLKHLVGLDRAVAYSVLARGWTAVVQLVTITLIARRLSPVEQGFYYTFGSLVNLQIVFELGFSSVILQLAAHEAAHLTIHASGQIEGPTQHHQRLASVFRKAMKWYTTAAILMACFLIPVGWRFFSTSSSNTGAVHWQLPMICVVLASSITFQIDPIFSFLEGCGYVANVQRTRLAQSILAGLLGWTALLLHHGLFAPALIISGQAIAGIVWVASKRGLIFHLLRHTITQHAVDWWKEVWPFQWRIAVSYACGYFIFQLFNPILFRYWGAVEAGRMGMSITVCNGIANIAIAWINTKAAPFGSMIARKEYAGLDRVFFRSVAQTVGLTSIGSLIVWSVAFWLDAHHLRLAQRILPPLPLGMMLISMNINQVVSSMALYLRAHKQEKFLLNSVLGAIFLSLSCWFLGRAYGALGMASGQLSIGIVLGLGLGSWTFFHYRRLWHEA